MEQRPTKKQRELLSFIDGFIKGYGYGPSYREIMRALDYKSVSTVASTRRWPYYSRLARQKGQLRAYARGLASWHYNIA
jgi:SOS-response transcriptional repressor LexA